MTNKNEMLVPEIFGSVDCITNSKPVQFLLQNFNKSLGLVEQSGEKRESKAPNPYRTIATTKQMIVRPMGVFKSSFMIYPFLLIVQSFDSIPNRHNFSRQASFTHALNWPGPAALSIFCNSSSSKRIFLAVLFERSNSRFVFFSCIGIYRWCNVFLDGIYHLAFNQALKITKLGSVDALTELLTTNDNLSIEVAMYKYTFLIGKGKARLSDINPIRLITVLAQSENQARFLAGNTNLVFAGRLPVQEVSHV